MSVSGSSTSRSRPPEPATELGLSFSRYFSRPGVDPFDDVEWELRAAVIGNERGQVVFEQRDVEIPKAWSQQATNIVVSKYFRGQIGTPERERSVKQLIGRVVTTITEWARKQHYFATDGDLQAFSDDLKHLLVRPARRRSTARCGSTAGSRRRRSAPRASSIRSPTRWTRF